MSLQLIVSFVIASVCLHAFPLLTLAQDSASEADGFRLFAWNVESSRPGSPPDSDPDVIAKQLTEMMKAPTTRSQMLALSEVDPKSVLIFKQAVAIGLGTDVDFVTSGSGGFQDTDTLMFVVDRLRFEIDETIEIHRFAGIVANFVVDDNQQYDYGALRARSPLAVRLRDKRNQNTFWVIVNHLARGEEDLRADQARMLAKWAAVHTEPVIAAGDFNFDYDFHTQKGNSGFDAMLADGTWEWLKPDPLIDTNWSDDRRVADKRVDRYPDSMLDFVFVANGAKAWKGESDVVVRDGDFPDTPETSDHRPIVANFLTDAANTSDQK